MSSPRQSIEAAIAALEAQRGLLGDTAVDEALRPLRRVLTELPAAEAPPAPPGSAAVPPAGPGPQPPPSSAPAAPLLRQASILFLDVVGSTTMSQHLDPEDLGAVMDGALLRCTAVVDAQGGRVLSYAGDNLLAVFGGQQSREDDAERAVRCGLDLLTLGRTLGAELRATRGHAGFDVRVGIHSGDVLLGAGVDLDDSIRGMAVNVAARMEQTAPPGALRISAATQALVRGLFDVQPQAPMLVKGVDHPVASFLVLRARPRAFRMGTRGIEGVATRMVGREAEFAALQEAYRRLLCSRRLARVTVLAEAGIGKSRLLQEWEAWRAGPPEPVPAGMAVQAEIQGRDPVRVLRGRCTPQTQGQPYGLLREWLAGDLGITDDDTLESARARMEQGLMPLLQPEEGLEAARAQVHLLGHLIGVDWRDSPHVRGILEDPRQIRDRALHAAVQVLRRLARGDAAALVLLLEDLHWADGETLDFIDHVQAVGRDLPLLILAFSRPSLLERRPDWGRAGDAAADTTVLRLHALDAGASAELAQELLQRLPQVPPDLRELLTAGAEGNPFYMEELVLMLIDQGAISTGAGPGDAWRVDAGRLAATRVPPTLTGVLQARLDGLPGAERLALQQASVVGTVFWDRALAALGGGAEEALPELERRELTLARRESRIEGQREYAFRHHLLQQVTYGTVLKRMRREMHGKLARWLAAQAGLRAEDFLGLIAGHYEQAGEADSAAEYHARAAEHARGRFAHEAALAHVERALALLGECEDRATAPLRWRLLSTRESTLHLQGDRDARLADIEALQRVAEWLDDDGKRAKVASHRSDLAMRMADFASMEAAAREAVLLAHRAGEHELRLRAQRLLALALAMQGELAPAEALARETLDEVRSRALRRTEALCLNTLAIIGQKREDPVGVLQLYQQALDCSKATGDRLSEAIDRHNVGVGFLELGDPARARREIEESLRLAHGNGHRELACAAAHNLSRLLQWQAEDEPALELARRAVATAADLKAPAWQVVSLLGLGDAELALGRQEAAEAAFREALALAERIHGPMRHEASAAIARVALARGDVAAALDAIAPLLALPDEPGTLEGADTPVMVELGAWHVLQAARDSRAEGWLARAHRRVQATAGRISDPALREGFLRQIPQHRQVVDLWAERTRPAPGHGGTDAGPGLSGP